MPDFRITIDVLNVSGADADQLAESIEDAHGDDYDRLLGDFKITVSQRQGSNWFVRDAGDDDLEG